MLNRYSLENYDFDLPKELIRQTPPIAREDARLMKVEGEEIAHMRIPDIIHFLEKDDVIVLNRTVVRKALLLGKKSTGGLARITLLRKNGEGFDCFIKGSVKDGDVLLIGDRKAIAGTSEDGKRKLVCDFGWDYVEKVGHLPLPPYIKKQQDFQYYQNEIGNSLGSIAAPTASLHFGNEMLRKINEKGVKVSFSLLSVGYGTFKGIKDVDIRKHVVDEEEIEVDSSLVATIENSRGKVVGVGTTVVRALETASFPGPLRPYSGSTGIFIYPGFKFNSGLTHLLTNFHIPRSSLLSLIYAFGGEERMKNAYKTAIEKKYYFYSLGDAVLMDRSA